MGMHPQELRLGNYLFGKLNKVLSDEHIQVVCVSQIFDPDVIGFRASIHTIREYIEFFQPIPLTEEWLRKFGFEFYYGYYPDLLYSNKLTIYKNSDGEFMEINKRIHIEYVHQLQNLFFAFIGEELTIQNGIEQQTVRAYLSLSEIDKEIVRSELGFYPVLPYNPLVESFHVKGALPDKYYYMFFRYIERNKLMGTLSNHSIIQESIKNDAHATFIFENGKAVVSPDLAESMDAVLKLNPVTKSTDPRDELIKAQEEYIEFFTDNLYDLAGECTLNRSKEIEKQRDSYIARIKGLRAK